MGDALAGIKRCDRLSNPSDLPLVHIEIFVDGLSGKKCSAATGTLGELLKGTSKNSDLREFVRI